MGSPNAAKIIGTGRHFSVFHLPAGTTPLGLQEYLTVRKAVGSPVQVLEVDVETLLLLVRVRMGYSRNQDVKLILLLQKRDRGYAQVARRQALTLAGWGRDVLGEHTVEFVTSNCLLDRPVIVDLARACEVGGGYKLGSPPWRYILLEDLAVFKGLELSPECWSESRDLSRWGPQVAGTGACTVGCEGCSGNRRAQPAYGWRRSHQTGYANF